MSEDVILALANVSQFNIEVYITNTQPLIYTAASSSCVVPVRIAFYDPGHYKAVVNSLLTSYPHTPITNTNTKLTG